MFQNDKRVILLNSYNTREDFIILKTFVPHNRDSKPRKHCTGRALLHEKTWKMKQNMGNNGFQALDIRQQRMGVPGRQEMDEVSLSGGDQADSPGRWVWPETAGQMLLGRVADGEGLRSPLVREHRTDPWKCLSLEKKPPERRRGSITWSWYKTRNTICSPDRKTS